MEKTAMKIMDHEFVLDDYQASFVKDKTGKIISISFPVDSFHELIEDVEDIAYLDGYSTTEEEKETISQEEIMEDLGLTPERIKAIRKEMGLTQAQLGEKIGYAAGTIRNIESGQNKINPRIERAIESIALHKGVII